MTNKLDPKAAVWAGLIAGLVFVVVEMLLVATVGGGSAWGPPRMIAAIGMGRDVLPPPATFDVGIVLVALVIHLILSVILGLILGWVISRWQLSMVASVIVGLVFGLAVYLVNFYVLTGVFPWFANARNFITIFAHLVFGGVLAGLYHAMAAAKRRGFVEGPPRS